QGAVQVLSPCDELLAKQFIRRDTRVRLAAPSIQMDTPVLMPVCWCGKPHPTHKINICVHLRTFLGHRSHAPA
ncbi:MAG: hypothetical protein ABW094_01030, partial [Candidatus Thiodiazotropha sp.]